MAIEANVQRTFPANDRRPEQILWEGVLVWEDPSKTDDSGRPSLVLKVQCGMRQGANGPFLTMPQQMKAIVDDSGQGRLRAKTWEDREGKTRYTPLITLGRPLQAMGVAAVQAFLAADTAASEAVVGDGGDLTTDAKDAFGDLAF